MNLNEMAKQYRLNAANMLERIGVLKAIDTSEFSYSEKISLSGRIRTLEGLYAESMSQARYLERYYELQSRGE